ncbi:MAG: hypothetical protein ACLFVU_04715 [Phycisphaerae bacterium]
MGGAKPRENWAGYLYRGFALVAGLNLAIAAFPYAYYAGSFLWAEEPGASLAMQRALMWLPAGAESRTFVIGITCLCLAIIAWFTGRLTRRQ